jgi:hypothetical protein
MPRPDGGCTESEVAKSRLAAAENGETPVGVLFVWLTLVHPEIELGNSARL